MKVTYDDDGVARYRAMQGDALDAIAFRFYGTHDGTTELLLEANPGLAALGPILPIGTVVMLPARAIATAPAVTRVTSLYD